MFIQPLDCDLAQQAYEERVRKVEQNLRLQLAHYKPAESASGNRASEWINQVKGWLAGRPRREVADARHPHAI